MIEVQRILYGCQWDANGHVVGWPLRVVLGAQGEETTVEHMLEGHGYTYMQVPQLVALIQDMQHPPDLVELCGDPPLQLTHALMELGYLVGVLRD